jgi:hypothetical protein
LRMIRLTDVRDGIRVARSPAAGTATVWRTANGPQKAENPHWKANSNLSPRYLNWLSRAKNSVTAGCGVLSRGTNGEQFLREPANSLARMVDGRVPPAGGPRDGRRGCTPAKSAGVCTSSAAVPLGDGELCVIGRCEVPGVEPRDLARSWPSHQPAVGGDAVELTLVAVPLDEGRRAGRDLYGASVLGSGSSLIGVACSAASRVSSTRELMPSFANT